MPFSDAVAKQGRRRAKRRLARTQHAAPSRRAVSHPSRQSGESTTPGRRRTLQARLQVWYTEHARDLPWRHTTDPYRIWVSEVMLQQTQVSTVVPYYARFLERFPTIESLAAATQDDVLKLWQGLGYYRRAVNLHRAACEVVERFDGRVPADATALRQLPGIGRYIAGAIQSFAFNAPAPILEANSARVLCRLFAVRGPLRDSSTQRRLWELSAELLSRRNPGAHNQALMELGALVCVSGRPRCERCPLARLCAARAGGWVDQLPETTARRHVVDVQDVAVVIRRKGRVLIVQRPTHVRWGGLWELPRTTVGQDGDPRVAARSYMRATLGLSIEVGRKLLTVKHGVTHHRITLSCYESRRVTGRVVQNGYADFRWELPERLGDYAFSSPQRKLIAAIQNS
jgi:A/G-specific adenine glycosylase